MTSAKQQSDNMLGNLPEELVSSIFLRCSPISEVRAAASCKNLQAFYKKQSKDLVSHSAYINSNTNQDIPLCPINTKKLLLTLELSSIGSDSDAVNTYESLKSRIDHTKLDGIAHLSSVQELAILYSTATTSGSEESTEEMQLPGPLSLQQLLQLLPNLKTLWLASSIEFTRYLACNGLSVHSNIHRASFEVPRGTDLALLPEAFPNLDTLCLDLPAELDAAYMQPLSQLAQLQYLSLDLTDAKHGFIVSRPPTTLPAMQHLQPLRHLKLRGFRINMCSIAGLLQLDSLSLAKTSISNPEALAGFNVTALMLHSVRFGSLGSAKVATQHRPAETPWPKLKRLYLDGSVSEYLLQAMRLPHPASGLIVKLRRNEFDDFHNEYNKRLRLLMSDCEVHAVPWYARLTYLADATPIIGPAYLAALYMTSLQVQGGDVVETVPKLQELHVSLQELYIGYVMDYQEFNAGCHIPTLRKLGLDNAHLDSEGWYNWLTKCPLLEDVTFTFDRYCLNDPSRDSIASLRTAADRLGMVFKHESYMRLRNDDYCIVRLHRPSH